MLKYEQRLLNPTREAVAEAAGLACREANKKCRVRLLKDEPAAWRRFARLVEAGSEGWELWRGGRGGVPATVVVGAWWTDALGRKHVRVVGRRAENYEPYLLERAAMDSRPPAWHVHPERLYRRRVGADSQVVAVCGCGAAGAPDALAWTGPCCGPCHDYAEEYGRVPFPAPAVLTGNKETVRAVCFDPTGRWVAGCEWSGRVLVWDREAGPDPVRAMDTFTHTPLDPQVGLTADAGRLFVRGNNGFVSLNLADPSAKPTTHGGYPTLALTPDGGHVLFATPQDVRTAPADLTRHSRRLAPVARAWGLSVSPDGSRVAAQTVSGTVVVIDRASGGTVAEVRPPVTRTADGLGEDNWLPPPAAFSPDGSLVAVAIARAVHVWELPAGKRIAVGEYPALVTGLTFAAGRLFVARKDGTLLAADPRVPADGVVLRWHLGPIYGLAAAPDGKTVATGGGEGVKLWPIARLLDGLEPARPAGA